MTGSYQISVKNSRNSYSFVIKRNITILCGDSGKGKTTLFEMIYEYGRFGKNSGVSISSDRPVIALEGRDWEERLSKLKNSIVVIDEDSNFIRSGEFAELVKQSDNYFLLITREYLPQLPYSVDEIYILEGRKNKKFVKLYREEWRMFDDPTNKYLPFIPEVIVTEDEKAGFQFFSSVSERAGITCISAAGKSNIYKILKEYKDKNVLIIADGAAFGADIGDVVRQQELRPRKLGIFLPESFEWLVLSSGVVAVNKNDDKIRFPEKYADSKKYESWEQYFTRLLMEYTKNVRYLKYKKEKLKSFYMQDDATLKILGECKGISLTIKN